MTAEMKNLKTNKLMINRMILALNSIHILSLCSIGNAPWMVILVWGTALSHCERGTPFNIEAVTDTGAMMMVMP